MLSGGTAVAKKEEFLFLPGCRSLNRLPSTESFSPPRPLLSPIAVLPRFKNMSTGLTLWLRRKPSPKTSFEGGLAFTGLYSGPTGSVLGSVDTLLHPTTSWNRSWVRPGPPWLLKTSAGASPWG